MQPTRHAKRRVSANGAGSSNGVACAHSLVMLLAGGGEGMEADKVRRTVLVWPMGSLLGALLAATPSVSGSTLQAPALPALLPQNKPLGAVNVSGASAGGRGGAGAEPLQIPGSQSPKLTAASSS